MTKESDIMHEAGDYWVLRDTKTKSYLVMRNGVTHSVSDSAYEMDDDGLSIAIARCSYLANRSVSKKSMNSESPEPLTSMVPGFFI